MKSRIDNKQIKQEYHASLYIIIYKMLLGFAELISGITLTIFGKKMLDIFTIRLTQELYEDPHDILAQLSIKLLPNIFSHNTYLILYLILLGSVKIAGATGLIYKQNWGVDLIVGMTVLLFPFQFIGFIIHPSIFDLIYIIVGIYIALYLIEFKPKAWISRILSHVL